jgi:purine-binding chemotaxis protein CheW
MNSMPLAQTTADHEEQLVIFTLGAESYGVSIEAVNTIIRFPTITRVPNSAMAILGVINLRGRIIPVVDLRTRFGLQATEASKATRVVVVEHQDLLVGLLVDAVTETLRLSTSAIEPLSSLVVSVDARYLRGVGKVKDRLIILLDLCAILKPDEIAELVSLTHSTPNTFTQTDE